MRITASQMLFALVLACVAGGGTSRVGLGSPTYVKAQAGSPAVKLNWLDVPPAATQGVSWGTPWPKGAMQRDASFKLTDAKGNGVAVQSWPLAYWPDGSLKWTGHAISAAANLAGPLTLEQGKPQSPQTPLQVRQTGEGDTIEIANGNTTWRIGKKGTFLVDAVLMGKQTVAQQGKLVCILEDRSDYKNKRTTREESFASSITSATVEQAGDVRAVVKIEGKHKSESSDRAWLPFTVRLYFFAGNDSVKMVHTFIFDGNEQKDFIRGLGLRFSVPMRQEAHNRHIRLGGETGMFAEPVRLIAGRRAPPADLQNKQIAGKPLPNLDKMPGKQNIAQMAVWDDFKLSQLSSEAFTIHKRTGEHSSNVHAAAGKRSQGLVSPATPRVVLPSACEISGNCIPRPWKFMGRQPRTPS